MKAKDKRMFVDNFFECLADRHNFKYEYRELEILKELFNSTTNMETSLSRAISKLRKLNQEIEQPIYYKRAKKNKGEVIVVSKGGKEKWRFLQ